MTHWHEEYHTLELNGYEIGIKLYVEWELIDHKSSGDEVQDAPEIRSFKVQVYHDRGNGDWWPETLPHFLLAAILPTDEMMIAWSEE